jgi:hypothetical protein
VICLRPLPDRLLQPQGQAGAGAGHSGRCRGAPNPGGRGRGQREAKSPWRLCFKNPKSATVAGTTCSSPSWGADLRLSDLPTPQALPLRSTFDVERSMLNVRCSTFEERAAFPSARARKGARGGACAPHGRIEEAGPCGPASLEWSEQ